MDVNEAVCDGRLCEGSLDAREAGCIDDLV